MKNTHDHTDDVVFDDEHEEASTADAVAKLQKVKAELKACRTERQEFLDGWQRMKADVANKTKEESARFARAKERAVEDFFESLLPALDSFDAAMQGTAWQTVDNTWRVGVEYIHTQFVEALRAQGIERYGKAGDMFDIALHEAAKEESGPVPGVIVSIERAGYKIGERVIRAARVVVSS